MSQKYEGVLSRQPKGNVEQYLNRWLTEYVEPNLSPNTVKGYNNIVTVHLIPGLGKIALKNIKAEHLQTYYADKLKTLNSTTVRHHHTLLHRAFKQAVLLDLMARNPADAVTPPRYHKAEMHILNESQVETVLSSTNPDYYALFYLALFSGLRRGELLALRWSDADLLMAEMSVSRSVVSLEGGGYVFKDTKTAKSRRTVALSPSTCQVLREHLDKQMAIKKRLEIKFHNDDLIFSHDNKNPFNGNAVSMIWRNLVRRLGFKGVRFHDCRHTMATAMLSAGVHPKIVQERLGHSSIAITLDTYSHVAPGLQHAAANKMDDVYNKSVTKSVVVS
jgi:integrase